MHALDLQGAPWRKSSRSSDQANCVEVAHLWRKSSRSGDDANCVEVAFAGPAVAVRDSKNRPRLPRAELGRLPPMSPGR